MVILGCMVAGSLGLLLAPYMLAAAPWGLAIPLVFAGGYAWLDYHRQRAVAAVADETPVPDDEGRPYLPALRRVTGAFDAMAAALALICAVAGAGAFTIGYRAAPQPPAPPAMEDNWTPPENALETDVAPAP